MISKRQRLPLVTLGLFPKIGVVAVGGNGNPKCGPPIVPRNTGAEADFLVLKQGGGKDDEEDPEEQEICKRRNVERVDNVGLFGWLPSELVLKILSKYVAKEEDLLNVRATCVLGERLCNEIFATRQALLLTNCKSVRAATIWCRSLLELHVSESNLSDSELCAIARGCPKIKVFKASKWGDVTSHGLGMFFSFLNKLDSLYLNDCPYLDDWAVTRLAERCPNLKTLSLAGCTNFGLEGVQALSRYLSPVEVILDGCTGLCNQALYTLMSSPFGHIRRLAIANCKNIDDAAVRWIGHFCPNLEKLNISGLEKISDVSLAAIAKGCRGLKELSCSRLPRLKSAGLALVLILCTQLEFLDASKCVLIRDIAFMSLHSSPQSHMKYINLKGCILLNEAGIAKARTLFPLAKVSHERFPNKRKQQIQNTNTLPMINE